MTNILIARNQDQGHTLIEAIGGDRTKWQVISYLGPSLAFKSEVLVIIMPDGDSFSHRENENLEHWFREEVPLIAAKAKKVVEIG